MEHTKSTTADDLVSIRAALDDAIWVNGQGACSQGWIYKDIKNNSSTNFITVTIQAITRKNGQMYTRTIVEPRIAPKEQRPVGCSGSGFTTTGYEEDWFVVAAAVYV